MILTKIILISLISIPCYLSGIFIVLGVEWLEERNEYQRHR